MDRQEIKREGGQLSSYDQGCRGNLGGQRYLRKVCPDRVLQTKPETNTRIIIVETIGVVDSWVLELLLRRDIPQLLYE